MKVLKEDIKKIMLELLNSDAETIAAIKRINSFDNNKLDMYDWKKKKVITKNVREFVYNVGEKISGRFIG